MLDGRYNCTIFCDTGTMKLSHNGVVELKIRDGALEGTMLSTFFWLPSSFRDGEFDGDNFSFTAFWNSPCQQYYMRVEGNVSGDDLNGTAESPIGRFALKGRRI